MCLLIVLSALLGADTAKSVAMIVSVQGDVKVAFHKSTADGIELTWDADADFESGLQQFIVERDGKEIGRVPEKLVPRFGRPLFQRKTHGDTAEAPLAEMSFVDKSAPANAKSAYRVISINSVGLKSDPSAEAKP